MIAVQCPDCNAKLRVSDAAAGKLVACAKCKARIRVPAPATTEDEVLEERVKPASSKAGARRAPASAPVDDEDERRSPARPRNDDDDSESRPRARSRRYQDDDDEYEDDDRPARSRRRSKPGRRRSGGFNPFRMFANMDPLIITFIVLGAMAFITLPMMLIWPQYFVVPIVFGCCVILFANLWFLALAFRDSVATGILVLFVPFFNVIFLIKNFGETCRPFFLSLVGGAVMGISFGSAAIATAILKNDSAQPLTKANPQTEPPRPLEPPVRPPVQPPLQPDPDPMPKKDPTPQPKNEPLNPLFPKKDRPAAIAKEIQGNVFDFLRKASSENRFAEVDIQGFKIGKDYREFVNDGALLVGFQVGYGRFINKLNINALRAVYSTRDGEAMGNWHGPAPFTPMTLKAKKGYAVAAVSVRTGIHFHAIAVHFAKFENGRLDLKDNYTTDWAGGPDGREATIGGQGYVFAGIVGHLNGEGGPCSLGLLAPREEPKTP